MGRPVIAGVGYGLFWFSDLEVDFIMGSKPVRTTVTVEIDMVFYI